MIKIIFLSLFLVACQADTKVNDFIVVSKNVEYSVAEDGAIKLENELAKKETLWVEEHQRVCAKMLYNEQSHQFEITGCNQ